MSLESTSFPIPASGEIAVTLTNDMLFHCVMQHSNAALKSLVCSIKGLNPSEVDHVDLLNPIDYSLATTKEVILDTKISLNSGEIMNIELQMYPHSYWKPRSLLYLCRSFDTIGAGENYNLLKNTSQICITDQELFPNQEPEFFSHFEFINTRYHYPYSTLLSLHVLNLNQISCATKDDHENGLVFWAELFRAVNWTEINRLISHFSPAKEVAAVMYAVNADVHERSIFEAHRKFLETKASSEAELAEKEAKLAEKDAKLAEKDTNLARLNSELSDTKSQLSGALEQIAQLKQEIAELKGN